MLKRSKIASLFMLIVLGVSMIQQPAATVAALEPQQPSSAGSWSSAFAGPFKEQAGLIPVRPIEWNNTLYSAFFDLNSLQVGVAAWSGEQWLKLDGLNGLADSLVGYQGRLYVAGNFNLGGKTIRMAYWNGTVWTALPYQFNQNTFLNMVVHDDQLYVGGSNLLIDGQTYGSLARWDGTQWHAAAVGVQGAPFSVLSTPDGLYLGGVFGLHGQNTGLIHWNGSQWQRVGGGLRGLVLDLEWANNQLYVSGEFTSTLEPTLKNVAAWDGTSWDTFGTGINQPTHSVVMVDGELYALSKSSNYQGSPHFHLQRWDTNQWTTLANMRAWNTSLVHYPDAVLVNYQQQVLAFGPMSFMNGTASSFAWGDAAMVWNDTHWQSMTPTGLAVTSRVALATAGEDLYAASNQMHWGNGAAKLAHLNAQNQWQSLIDFSNETPTSPFEDLEKYQQTFFGVSNRQLFQTANTAWNPVSPINTFVYSLAQANNLLYVAGDFEQFNGLTAHNLVTWNGSQWQALDTPATFNAVTVVEADANAVYISDGTQLARWDGAQWQMLASAVNSITSIEPTADGVYIAGTFSSVAGVSAAKIAYWNGSTWSGLSGVINGAINDLEMGADGLYVAGTFAGLTNGIVSPGILRWDGTAWHGLNGGVQAGYVAQLAATPTRMLLYGTFKQVGNQYESSLIAAWEYGNEPLIRAKTDYAITYRPQPVTVNVLANDWSDQPSQLQLLSVAPSSNGTAVISGTQLVYTPASQFQGTDTLTYTVRDPLHAVTTTAQVRVHVWNHFPLIADKERQVQPFAETIFFPLNGLVDLNGDELTITQASAVSGTVQIDADRLRYLPPQQQQVFTDTLTYTVSDGHGGQQTARIKLFSTNASVVAVNDNATTYRPHAVMVDVLANDWAVNNEPLQLVAVNRPAYGTATISGNQVHYLPDANFQGIVSVQYTVRNVTRGTVALGIVLIDVLNHAPTVAPLTLTLAPHSTTLIDALAQASDLNGDALTINQASATVGEVDIIGNQLRYRAPNNTPFTATISYRVDDSHGGVTEGTITVNSARYQLFLPYTSK
ncbi:Ig-like domain-containing protein [Herpetosiphon llansteffanensis]|uniref:Ig-like domain-containing protein n=1 Tax=Herpetosiphon llansteffanensis TaxID=2094568 RepID=UPI000D7CEF16|nr:Ig-like domain-containing protein [Herpetosiphon llansteffanensis]